MTEKEIQPWIAVNRYMDDAFREHVAQLALDYLPLASRELQEFAYQMIDQGVSIPGFRSVKRTPKPIALRHLLPEFKTDNAVASTVVALWAEAHMEMIDEVRQMAEGAGLHFLPDWPIAEGMKGFLDYEDIPALHQVISQVMERMEKPTADEYMLATFFLSLALVPKPLKSETAQPSVAQGVPDTTTIATEPGSTESSESQEDDMDQSLDQHPSLQNADSNLDVAEGDVPREFEGSLEEMERELKDMFARVEKARHSLIDRAKDIQTQVRKSNLDGSKDLLLKAGQDLEAWEEEFGRTLEFVMSLNPRLLREDNLRPDLHCDLPEDFTHGPGSIQRKMEKGIAFYASIIDQLIAYDQQREEKRVVLSRLQAEIAELQEEIALWEPGEGIETDLFVDSSEMTLSEIGELIQHMQVVQQDLKAQKGQSRELSINRIGSLLEKLVDLGVDPDETLFENMPINQMKVEKLVDWTSSRLTSLEQSLGILMDKELSKAQSLETSDLARSLQEEWSEESMVSLLENLSRENRDVECLLASLGFNNVHPRQSTVELSTSAVRSLLVGLAQLSKKSHPFQLLSLLASQFISGWETSNPKSQAELCIVFLAAHYAGKRRLPEGFLWNLPMEWPLTGMDNWSRLWQASLNEELIQFIDGQGESSADLLEQARQRAMDMFAVKHGRYVRLSGVKSGRHLALLNNEIMPWLEGYRDKIKGFDDRMESVDQKGMSQLLIQLESLLSGQFRQDLGEDSIKETYEKGVSADDIQDTDPFHRRTSLRTLNESAESILDYAEALKACLKDQLQSGGRLSVEGLRQELTRLPDPSGMTQAALDQIVQGYEVQTSPWDEMQAGSQGRDWLAEELLQQPSFALRLPRTIAYLTQSRMEWDEMLGALLSDLSDPLDPSSAADHLLEKEAPNHVLELAQHIPVEIQKQAQALKRKLEQEADGLQVELLQLGGSAEDLQRERNLDRWQLYFRELEERLSIVRAEHEEKTQRVRAEAHQLRTRINDLDNRISAIIDTLPVDAYQVVENGLAVARRVCGQEENFDHVLAYLDEIQYRLDHQSWPVAELHDATEEIERLAAHETQLAERDMAIESVLELFERGEVGQLGLAENDIPSSSFGTRIDLLRNWIAVRSASAFRYEEQFEKDRIAIENLFRHFAKMTAMKRWLDPQGKPIIYEHPVISYMMGMSFPKTAALDDRYMFLALPGDPPSPKDIRQMELLLEDKKWLDYFYVILFIPGCTQKIRDRLKSSYRKRKLVIVDDRAILRMVLAEKGSQNPVGRFRPIILNALETDNVDVFKFKNLVDARTSIFVGRDREVERITSSGDNYAIYGGRLIGKSSVLKAVENLLLHRGVEVVNYSFQGQEDCSDDQSAVILGKSLNLNGPISNCGEFRSAIQAYLEENPDANLVLLLDEIDYYIDANKERHILIETLRSLSERFDHRFRIVIAGFMHLYDCLNGRGPYTPASDPWGRMLNDPGPLRNLRPASAERIVREGFLDILGWRFESRAIPQRIVELTGGHPAFVQYFCKNLQERVGKRGDLLVKLDDIEAVFQDRDPDQSFIAFVRKTLEMNLDLIGRYLILWLTSETEKAKGFTFDQMLEYANLADAPISEDQLFPSIDRLKVTSVIKEVTTDVYEFSVPDYPLILSRMGETAHMDSVERELERYLAGIDVE